MAMPGQARDPGAVRDSRPVSGKLLGIGLSRTGTLSLSLALGRLGYRTAHFVDHRRVLRGQDSWLAGDFREDSLAGYDAAVDLPVPAFYVQLDARYPGSRFILTVREAGSWIASMRRHWAATPLGDDPQGEYRRRVRLAMYGISGFSEERMRQVYETHQRGVHQYFAHRPDDLLVLDICGGQGWEPLCAFLGCEPPPEPFPWAHKSP